MRYLGPGEKVLFMQKSFWRPSEARYLIKEIKCYEKVCTCKRGSKDLVFNGKGWKDFDENRLTFLGDLECFSTCRSEYLIMRQPKFCR